MSAAGKAMDPKDLENLYRLEESLWRGETRYDKAAMERVFSEDFVEFGRSGRIYTREEMLFEPGSGREIDATLPLPKFRARHLSADVVLVTYISEVMHDGTLVRGNRSSIWSRGPDGWRLRFHQGTPTE